MGSDVCVDDPRGSASAASSDSRATTKAAIRSEQAERKSSARGKAAGGPTLSAWAASSGFHRRGRSGRRASASAAPALPRTRPPRTGGLASRGSNRSRRPRATRRRCSTMPTPVSATLDSRSSTSNWCARRVESFRLGERGVSVLSLILFVRVCHRIFCPLAAGRAPSRHGGQPIRRREVGLLRAAGDRQGAPTDPAHGA